MNTVKNATAAILKAAAKNKFITSESLRTEAIEGSIDGWMNLAAVRACNFSEWTAAMFAAAFQIDVPESAP